MSEQPIFKAKHDVEDIDASTLSVHHTIGTFRHQAAGGAHNHNKDDPSSLPLFVDQTFNAGDPRAIWDVVEDLGATVENKPDTGWKTASLLNGFQHYNTSTWGPVGYRRLDGGLVQITGLVKRSGNTSGGLTIFILPVGYRPTYNNRKHCANMKISAFSFADINIEMNGNVVYASDNPTFNGISWLSLDFIFKI